MESGRPPCLRLLHSPLRDHARPTLCPPALRRQTWNGTIHTSKSLNGPWETLANDTMPSCNNPAPLVLPNGTIIVMCNQDWAVKSLYSAPHLTGVCTAIPDAVVSVCVGRWVQRCPWMLWCLLAWGVGCSAAPGCIVCGSGPHVPRNARRS